MTDDSLYELAQKRIDRRNRIRVIWSIHLAALIAYVGVFIWLATTGVMGLTILALVILLAWSGIFTLHTIIFGLEETREGDIKSEIAKLREVVYEKPKRLELNADGELIDDADLTEMPEGNRKRDKL